MTTSVQSQGTRGVAPPVPPAARVASRRIEPWCIAPLWQAGRVALGDLLGNPGAVAGLRHALDSGQLGHALLVTGPDQVGKTALMLSLAGELLPGGSWPGDPSTHPDLWLEDSSDERISIRRVRAGGDPGASRSSSACAPMPVEPGWRSSARADRLTERRPTPSSRPWRNRLRAHISC